MNLSSGVRRKENKNGPEEQGMSGACAGRGWKARKEQTGLKDAKNPEGLRRYR